MPALTYADAVRGREERCLHSHAKLLGKRWCELCGKRVVDEEGEVWKATNPEDRKHRRIANVSYSSMDYYSARKAKAAMAEKANRYGIGVADTGKNNQNNHNMIGPEQPEQGPARQEETRDADRQLLCKGGQGKGKGKVQDQVGKSCFRKGNLLLLPEQPEQERARQEETHDADRQLLCKGRHGKGKVVEDQVGETLFRKGRLLLLPEQEKLPMLSESDETDCDDLQEAMRNRAKERAFVLGMADAIKQRDICTGNSEYDMIIENTSTWEEFADAVRQTIRYAAEH